MPDVGTRARREHQTCKPGHTRMCGSQIQREHAGVLMELIGMDTRTLICAHGKSPERWCGSHMCREHRGGCPKPGPRLEPSAVSWLAEMHSETSLAPRWHPRIGGQLGLWVSSSRTLLWERTEFLPALPALLRCTSRTPRSREGWPWAPPPR